MLEICALASGSNGNCYYIGNDNEAILIDAGIHYNRLIERLDEAKLDKSKIKAIFISHEHTDHVQGIRGCSKKLSIPGIFSQHTYFKSLKRYQPDLYAFFEEEKPYTIGGISVFPFKKQHDASDPYSFRVECNGKNIGVFTDIGEADKTLEQEFNKCQAVFLETNYDKDMLWNGGYPIYIKKRVDSSVGHLSNEQALELVKNHASPDLKTIFLSHISFSNNTHELVLKAFSCLNGKYDIKLTSRQGISEVIHI
jgi:phosphoribosyl 1,2-cyclic phosphodiesterase